MERDNKVLLGAVLILLVAMLSFNFNSITGNATNTGKVTITATPSEIYFSEKDLYNNEGNSQKIVTVTINAGLDIDSDLKLYSEGGLPKGKIEICNTLSSCKKGVYKKQFKISSNLPEGNYFFRIDSKRGLLVKNSDGEDSYVREKFDSNMLRITHFTPSFRGN